MALRRFHHLFKESKKKVDCQYDDCIDEGLFRAPKDRFNLIEHSPLNVQSYLWFCAKHIKIYNTQWNYYAGMCSDEIIKDRSQDMYWNRPTQPLGGQSYNYFMQQKIKLAASESMFAASCDSNDQKVQSDFQDFSVHSIEYKALKVLALSPPISILQIKTAYKKHVKACHPDLHNGCRHNEEQLKKVNQAYHCLKKAFAK